MKRDGTNAFSKRSKDLDVGFDDLVHELITRIPAGRVATYKGIALALGSHAYRAVGRACNRSPGMPQVPCHRVVASDGRLHGFAQGLAQKKRLLESEGVQVTGAGDAMRVDLSMYRFRFDESGDERSA